MTISENLHPTLFCPQCQSYLGVQPACDCGYQRPQSIPTTGEARWQFNAAGRITARPLVTDNAVFIGSRGGGFYALNRVDGSVRWQKDDGGRVQTSAVPYRQSVIFGADDGSVHALDVETGAPLWDTPFRSGNKVQGGMALAKGIVYFGNHSGEIFALNAQSGTPLWHAPFVTRKPSPVKSVPVIKAQTLFVGGYDGGLYAIDPLRGKEIWYAPTGARIAASPVVTSNTVIAANLAGDISAFTHFGRELWHKTVPAGIHGTPAFAAGTLYFGTLDGNFYALKVDGQSEPRVIFRAADAIADAPLIVDELIYFGANDGYLYAFNLDDEREFGRFNAGTALFGSPAFFKGEIYIGGENGIVFAVPWHLGEWAKAAEHLQHLGDEESAAAYFALAGDEHAALEIWHRSTDPGRAAALLDALLEPPETVAEEFEHAAQKFIQRNKVRAAVYFLRAADFYAEADLPEKEKNCLNKTARLAPLPRLKIEAVNIPVFEEDEPGAIAFNIRNFGKGAAHHVAVELGGTLKHPVSFELSEPIQPADRISGIEISDILPTDTRLRVAISYTDRHGTAFHYHKFLEVALNRIDADIVIGNDSVASIHLDGTGDTLPKVHVKEGAVLNLRSNNRKSL